MNEKQQTGMRDLGGRDSDSLTHVDSRPADKKGDGTLDKQTAQRLENPLVGKSRQEIMDDVDRFVESAGLHDIKHLLRKGALVAQDADNFERLDMLDDDEKHALREERDKKWKQTWTLYWVVFMTSMAAVVQGMDETVINGAQLFYPQQFGIGGKDQHSVLLVGLVNSAPYLCSAVFSCWLTYPLNRYFGRRGAIFISTLCAGLACIWSAVTNTWWHLFISRLFLGLGIGPKSATVPVLSAEIAPARIRGALVMQWQTWTAFGIMFGTVSSLVFYHVPDKPGITGLNWRLMLGSACLPAIIVCSQVYFTPESPRWLIGQKKFEKAYQSFSRLRTHPLLAARDLYYTSALVALEDEIAASASKSKIVEMFTIPRNRRAVLASSIVMFGQQFCGVNSVAYYSSNIFKNAGSSDTKALLGSFGYGLLNWAFAYPAFFTIDTFGRRSLLLFTFPFLSITMVIAALGFIIKNSKAQLGVVTTGVYLFTCFYSPGMGPVPFSYSAEVYPLQIRELGMALATAITWLFNFVIALTFPLLLVSFGNTGAFLWFAAWNALLYFLVLLFVPETKQFTLEELDEVFSMSTRRQMQYGLQTWPFLFKKYILRKKVHRTPLHEWNPSEEKDAGTVTHKEHA